MSCLGPSYNPNPTRTWFRFDNNLNDLVSSSEGPIAMLNKGNVLQYKKNSSRLTKGQRYAELVRGNMTRKKAYASQTETTTNFNTRSMQLRNSGTIITNNVSRNNPITCNSANIPYNNLVPANYSGGNTPNTPIIPPPPPPPPPPSGDSNPLLPPTNDIPDLPPVIIPDGGTLTCNIIAYLCTGEILKVTNNRDCYPTTDSNVPLPLEELCYDGTFPTFFPHKVYNPSSGNST